MHTKNTRILTAVVNRIAAILKRDNRYVNKYLRDDTFLEQKMRYLKSRASNLKTATENKLVEALTVVVTDGEDNVSIVTPDRYHKTVHPLLRRIRLPCDLPGRIRRVG